MTNQILNTIISNTHFSIMGHYADRIYIRSHRSGSFISCGARDISKGIIRQLAPQEFWRGYCPSDSSLAHVIETVSELICRGAEHKGIFDVKKIRGCGAWIDEGKPIFHLGTKILSGDNYIDIRDFKSEFVYPIKYDLMIKSCPMLPKEQSSLLIELCNKLSWEDSKSGMLFAGWLFMAPLCGALPWRSHIYILGGPGTGKSYVMSTMIPSILGELPLKVQGASTEAGIRQYLDNDARPVIFDEAEGNDQAAQFRLQAILSLARQASTPDAAAIIKGSVDGGKTHIYFIRSVFAMSSIELPIKEEADKQRFTILRLRPFPKGTNIEKFQEILKFSSFVTPEYSSGLLSRGMKLLPKIIATQKIFMEVGEIIFGKRRVADQMSMMLAGVWHLTHDEIIEKDYALEWMLEFEWREQQEIAVSTHDMDLLNYILDYNQNHALDGGGQVSRTTRELIEISLNGRPIGDTSRLDKIEANRIIKRYGFRINEDRLEISNKSQFIKKIIKDTHWAFPCHESLGRINGAEKSNQKVSRFADIVSSYVSIPMNLVLEGNPEPEQQETTEEEW